MKHLKLLMLAIITLVVAWVTYASTVIYSPTGNEINLANKIHDYRTNLGLPFYFGNDRINAVAQNYAKKMAGNWFLSDIERDGTTPADRLLAWGFVSIEAWEAVMRLQWTSCPTSAMEMLISSANELLTSTEFDTMWVGNYGDYRVFLVGIDDYLHRTQTMPICDWAIEANSFPNRIALWKTGCFIEWIDPFQYPITMTIPSTRTPSIVPIKDKPVFAPVKTPVVKAKALMVWKVTEAKFLENLNRIYGKKLNGKKLYLK